MPLINGRYYANPAYGEAMERARMEEAADGAEQQQTPPAPSGPLANRIYNETSGLRTSAPDLVALRTCKTRVCTWDRSSGTARLRECPGAWPPTD